MALFYLETLTFSVVKTRKMCIFAIEKVGFDPRFLTFIQPEQAAVYMTKISASVQVTNEPRHAISNNVAF